MGNEGVMTGSVSTVVQEIDYSYHGQMTKSNEFTMGSPSPHGLAINSDGTGHDWEVTTIGREMGSVYPTMFEVEPNVLFCQVDGWYWRVTLSPKK